MESDGMSWLPPLKYAELLEMLDLRSPTRHTDSTVSHNGAKKPSDQCFCKLCQTVCIDDEHHTFSKCTSFGHILEQSSHLFRGHHIGDNMHSLLANQNPVVNDELCARLL